LKDYGYSGNVIFQRGKKQEMPKDLVKFSSKFNGLFVEMKWELANNLISGSAKELFNKTKMNYGIILESGSGGTKCAICFRDSEGLIWQCVHNEKILITDETTHKLQEFVDTVRTKYNAAPLAIVFSGGFVSTYDDPIRKKWILANNALSPNLQIPEDLKINSGEACMGKLEKQVQADKLGKRWWFQRDKRTKAQTELQKLQLELEQKRLQVAEIKLSNTTLTLQEICQQREAEHEYKGFLAVFPEYENATYDNIVFVGMGGGTVQCCVNGEYKSEVTKGIEGFNLKKGEQGNYVDNKIFSPEDQNNICILSSTCFHIVDKEVAQYNLRLGLSTDQQYDIDDVVNTIKEKFLACFDELMDVPVGPPRPRTGTKVEPHIPRHEPMQIL
jgi:hypothetical protein